MEALLFLIDGLLTIALVVFSLLDDRVPDAKKTGFFRYAVDPAPGAPDPKRRLLR